MRLTMILIALVIAACAPRTDAPPPSPQTRTTTTVTNSGPVSTLSITTYQGSLGIDHAINAAADSVWEVLPTVYEEMGVPVETIDIESNVVGNIEFDVRRRLAGEPMSRLLDCGAGAFSAPLADRYLIRMSLTTGVSESENETSIITTRLAASASNPAVSGGPVNCSTTGRLEQAIADRVTSLVR